MALYSMVEPTNKLVDLTQTTGYDKLVMRNYSPKLRTAIGEQIKSNKANAKVNLEPDSDSETRVASTRPAHHQVSTSANGRSSAYSADVVLANADQQE
jgi:hypothetical protein